VRGWVKLSPLGNAATNWPILPAKINYNDAEIGVMMIENLAHCRFVHHKPHMRPDANPGRRDGKPTTNRLSYGTA
jgi:hypothetical protein